MRRIPISRAIYWVQTTMEDKAMNSVRRASIEAGSCGERTNPVQAVPRACDFTLADIDEYLTNSRTFNRAESP